MPAAPSEKPSTEAAVPPPAPPLALIAANGLPAPPPEKPAVPARCPPLDPAALVEWTPVGRLPRIDANGCMPWLANAAAFNYRETRPRVGVIVLGLGKDPQLTQRAIDALPPRISLGFASDAPWLDRWIDRARARGHEVLVMLPVQAPDKPRDSTWPPLRADVAPEENMRRLHTLLARAGAGYIGVIVPTTTPLSSTDAALRPLLKEVGDRGLLVLETFRTGRTVYETSKDLGLPYSSDAGWIDRRSEPDEITANLQALEEFTLVNRFALAVATAQRETIERLIAWSKDIETRGIALAPVTGLTECVDLCAERVRKAMVGGGGR
ncbi:divergent polysaccharide deacetylase family protein [Vineibacter terrae]|uniref:divergent polysaccharide deacetylase family protein n=1 Tax=Vineibacter terrae TaxID=2586908 RepID=UPI002E32C0CB|nr:divergent polysaccharide deacetylase family protein [Vineibacter terrae]HEX2890127.1 divergent polysaccharide deacetylase family protein [Vineibacter terrae]